MEDQSNPIHISVVSPVYRAESMLDELIARIESTVSAITPNYEIILVEDGGPDRSWQKIASHCETNPRVVGIKLSKNFGQHHAITAGLDQCKGDWVVVMDCDLQDRPEEIKSLYETALRGYDIVYARRINRQDSFFKKLSSIFFYKAFGWLSGLKHDGAIANFGIYSKSVISAVNQLREPLRSFATMVKWVGFKHTAVNVEHGMRSAGKSTYNWKRLLNLALDISLAYSDKPLRMTIVVGAIISSLAIIFGSLNLYYYFTGRISQPGYASLIISIWFLSGLIIFTLGIIGLYLSKVFEGVKKRPLYIIATKINADRT